MATTAALASSSQPALPPTSKRRLSSPPSDASDSGEPATKRTRPESSLVVDNGPERPVLQQDPAANGRDRKKRRKKKRKQPISQQVPAAGVSSTDKAAANGDSQTMPPKTKGSTYSVSTQTEKPASSSVEMTPATPRALRPDPSSTSPTMKLEPIARTYDERGVGTEGHPSPRRADKGKARALSPIAEPRPSIAANAAQAQDLATHRTLLDALFPSLTCQICLLLMHRPFALAPCGHVACHSCLMSWFSNDPGHPHPPPANVDANANQNANPDAHPNAANAAPGPARPSALHKKKTCPHCRAVVLERPTEVWAVKEMVLAAVKSGLADPDSVPLELRPSSSSSSLPSTSASTSGARTPEDPWAGVFRPARKIPDYLFEEGLPGSLAPPLARFGVRDEEDGGIYRCMDCLHEIWDGACTGCGREYPGHFHGGVVGGGLDGERAARLFVSRYHGDGESEEEGEDGFWGHEPGEEDEEGHREFIREMWRMLGAPGGRREARLVDLLGSDGEDDDDYRGEDEDVGEGGSGTEFGDGEDEEYEGSFIDDAEVVGGEGDEDEDEVEEIPPPYVPVHTHARAHGRRAAPIVISDDEADEAEVAHPAPRRPQRVVSEDGGDDEIDEDADAEGLAALVAARERAMYGDDGSLPSRAHRRGREGEEHGGDDYNEEPLPRAYFYGDYPLSESDYEEDEGYEDDEYLYSD